MFLIHKGLPVSGRPFLFRFGCNWVQNLAQLHRDPRVILTCDVRVHTKREPRVAVPEPLLPHLQRSPEPIHEAAVRVAEGVQSAARNS